MMKLAEALDIEGESIIALAGGGGKTTSLFLLGKELTEGGRKVVLAAAAKMYKPSGDQFPILLENRAGIIGQRAAEVLKTHPLVVAGAGVENGKLTGLPCPLLLELAARPEVDNVITEADGSQGLPLKFPAEYEPVVCSSKTVVVPVLGISALGKRLNEGSFQRWHLACKHLGVEYGAEITPELAAAVLCHPLSYGRFLGVNRVVPLVNQVENEAQEDLAWQMAKILIAKKGIHRVVIGAVQTDRPVRAIVHRKGERDV